MCCCCPLCCSSCAAVFCLIESFFWSIFAIVGTLAYSCNVTPPANYDAGKNFFTTWYDMYFKSPDCYIGYNSTPEYYYLKGNASSSLVSPEQTYQFMISYSVISVLWFVSCICLMIGQKRNSDKKSCVVIWFLPFLICSAASCILDVIAGVAYGLDIADVANQIDGNTDIGDSLAYSLMFTIAIVMCALSLRGGLFWIINIVCFICIFFSSFCAACKQSKSKPQKSSAATPTPISDPEHQRKARTQPQFQPQRETQPQFQPQSEIDPRFQPKPQTQPQYKATPLLLSQQERKVNSDQFVPHYQQERMVNSNQPHLEKVGRTSRPSSLYEVEQLPSQSRLDIHHTPQRQGSRQESLPYIIYQERHYDPPIDYQKKPFRSSLTSSSTEIRSTGLPRQDDAMNRRNSHLNADEDNLERQSSVRKSLLSRPKNHFQELQNQFPWSYTGVGKKTTNDALPQDNRVFSIDEDVNEDHSIPRVRL